MSEHEFELRVTIYADGKRVGTCDQLGSSLTHALGGLETALQRGEVDQLTRWGREVLDAESGDLS